VAVYREEDNKVIEVITNNPDWSSVTAGELYERCRLCGKTFFKLMNTKPTDQNFFASQRERLQVSNIYSNDCIFIA
jgi:hypothetical protein